MAEFPALPLWTDALIGDTYHLTPAEFGAYLRLLIAEWRNRDCSLPNDDVFLGRAIGDHKNWHRLKPVVMAFFTLGTDNRFRQQRLLDERDYVSRLAARASAGGRGKALKRIHRDTAKWLLNECETPAPIPIPIPIPTKKKEEKTKGAEAPRLPEWMPIEAWNGFVEMRKKIHKPMTGRAINQAISKIESLKADGHDPIAVLDQSTLNCWQDVWPIRPGGMNGHAPKNASLEKMVEGWRKEHEAIQNGDKSRNI